MKKLQRPVAWKQARLSVKEDNKMENVKVTLIKSLIACKPNQIATAKSLGLTKIGNSIVLNNDQVLAGKIKVISHLVKVENV